MEQQQKHDGLEIRRDDAAAREQVSLEGEGGSLLPMPAIAPEVVGRELQLPTRGELELMLSRSDDGDSLAELEKAAATLVDVAKRQDLVKEQFIELAEWHLRVKRKLGALLLQTDARGGDRAKCQAATLLPGNLDPSAAKRLRKLGRVDDDDFVQYLGRSRSVSRIPSAEGALKFAKSKGSSAVSRSKVAKKPKVAFGDIEVSPQVLDAIKRCLGDIDLCVGGAPVECRRRVAGAKVTPGDLQGIVLVTARVDPEVWLNQISEMRCCAQCDQVVVILAADTAATWFRSFCGANWHLCFLANPDEPTVAAYLGTRSEAFFAAMHDHGLVVRVHE